ncbi:HIT family protein [Brevibacillus borstelensis]|uniref:HIT family protein n=1 Tax=Brevibacillus borstelensis TaxID=45462 RepID=UPI0030C1CF7B
MDGYREAVSGNGTGPTFCLGCRLAHALDHVHTVYEDEWVRCILDIDPFQEGHTLILPKRHVAEWMEIEPELAFAITEAVKTVSAALTALYRPDGITVCQNGGVFRRSRSFSYARHSPLSRRWIRLERSAPAAQRRRAAGGNERENGDCH